MRARLGGWVQQVRVLRLRPGDVVAVRTTEPVGAHVADQIADQLREVFPGHRVMVIAPNFTLELIRRAKP